jgi:hypothetical protein
MNKLMLVFLFAILAMVATPPVSAQVVVGVEPLAPACEYGYFDYAPYACAPYGYYDAGWFMGGLFIGAGPWFGGHYNAHYVGGFGYHGARGGYSRAYASHSRVVVHGGGGFHGGGGHGGGHR